MSNPVYSTDSVRAAPLLKKSSIKTVFRVTPPDSLTTAVAMITKKLLTTAGSLAASAVDLRRVANDLIPQHLQSYVHSAFARLLSRLSSHHTILIEEYSDSEAAADAAANQLYSAAETYLAAKASPAARRLRVSASSRGGPLEVTMQNGEEVTDTFRGDIKFKWRLVARESRRQTLRPYHDTITATTTLIRSFELTFHRKHKGVALESYLPFVQERSRAIKEQTKPLKLHINVEGGSWTPVSLQHPAMSVAALVMAEEAKKAVMEDLGRFVRCREYCTRIGKVWKRGYLLRGPGAAGGKSGLVAAMANFLRFDVYDLELADVRSMAAMRALVIGMADRSILHVKGVDCSSVVNSQRGQAEEGSKNSHNNSDAEEKVTLSELLNFADRLWSGCGGERIIVVATENSERLDRALLQPGWMDITMGHCSPSGFRALLKNYHGVDHHPLLQEIDELITQATVAEVEEELMIRSGDPTAALKGLLELLKGKEKDACETKAREQASEVGISSVRSYRRNKRKERNVAEQACGDNSNKRSKRSLCYKTDSDVCDDIQSVEGENSYDNSLEMKCHGIQEEEDEIGS